LRDIFSMNVVDLFNRKRKQTLRKSERSRCQYQEVFNDSQEVSQIIYNRS